MKYETIVCPFCGNGHAHITYEENRVYQLNCPDCHNAIFHRDTSWDNAVNFFKRMVVTDEATLRAQQEQERNDPLALDELRQMDGEPVRHGRWEEVDDFCGDSHWRCSACGCEWYFEAGGPVENGSNYCPNCGARMDKEEHQ